MPNNPASGREFAGLEIAQFLCALAVMFWHYQHFFYKGIYESIASGGDTAPAAAVTFPLHWLFGFFYDNGNYAVPVFWMISGFIFFWKYGATINEGRVSAYQFFILRFSRLYPLHFATLLLVALLQFIYIQTHGTSFIYDNNDVFHFVLQLGFASNWVDGRSFTFNGPIWSVSIEVLVYAFFLAVVSFLKPSLILCLVVALAAKAAGHFWPQRFFECAQFFFVGGIVQLVAGNCRLAIDGSRSASGVLGLCVSIETHFRLGSIIGLSFFVVTSFALLDEVVSLRRSNVVKIGDLTYASYLLHFPVQLAIVLTIDALGLSRNLFLHPAALVAFIAGTFGLAWIVFQAYEMPAQGALRAAWLRRRERASTAA